MSKLKTPPKAYILALIQRSVKCRCAHCKESFRNAYYKAMAGEEIEIKLIPDININDIVTGWHFECTK